MLTFRTFKLKSQSYLIDGTKTESLIIDDEESARKLLSKLLEETLLFSDIKVAQSVTSANLALTLFDPDMVSLISKCR